MSYDASARHIVSVAFTTAIRAFLMTLIIPITDEHTIQHTLLPTIKKFVRYFGIKIQA
jgi:hypothetical protein